MSEKERLNMQTKNLAEEKFKKLKELFPNAVTEIVNDEGEVVPAIDKDTLMQEISSEVVEGNKERYQFTWPNKREAVLAANAPTSNTLRPCREESVNFDETENLYIEGDNLEVLKQLQETYLGKVKMIYIDPPYNTGKDFVYKDDFKSSINEYTETSGQYDEEGNRLETNPETHGRFHTDWLNMMYPRLKLARNLLSEDGVIFISIDDSEQTNLKKICDEIFGEKNFLATTVIDGTPKNDSLLIATSHEYMLVYFKNKEFSRSLRWGAIHPLNFELNNLVDNKPFEEAEKLLKEYYAKNKLKQDNIANYKFVDEGGIYRTTPLDDPQSEGPRDNRVNLKTGNYLKVPNRGWSTNIETWNEWVESNLIKFPDTDDKLADKKTYLNQSKLEVGRSVKEMQGRKATSDLKKMFDDNEIFTNPKPVTLLEELMRILNDKNAIVLDFFSGSASTAEAVIDLNAKDEGNRKFIMVQIQEEIDSTKANTKKSKKVAENAIRFLEKIGKPTYISEIGKERIRRAGQKILEENKDKEGIENLDVGFRVLKLDSSNMKDVYYTPEDTDQNLLDLLEDNIKEDRTSEDLLFQVMLELGVPLSSSIEKEEVAGKEVLSVEDGFLVACFDKDMNEETVKAIAERKPYYAVFRDSSMANDSVATNFDQIFESISPETIRRVV